jgi:uncharacterized coiled-coil protein SlyX
MKLQNLIHILIGIVCIGLLPKAQAVSPPPDGGYPGFNTAEGDSALKNLNTAAGVGNTAVGWLSLFSDVEGGFNTAIGAGALALNTGGSNTGIGAAALILNTGGERNTAVGTAAMVNNNVGNDNTAVGDHALASQTGEGPNTAVGSGALFKNTLGDSNTANGTFALFSNTEGDSNTAVGASALFSNSEGGGNTATGAGSLSSNTTGGNNTATGSNALVTNTAGSFNTAIGFSVLFANTEGIGNTGIGDSALSQATGSGNIGVGAAAGTKVTTANNAICIGTPGANQNDSCYIGNIFAREVALDGIPVLVDSLGKLGTQISSRRFKKDIQPMDKASETILALKPVSFRYKSDGSRTPCFGLIAEEVAEVNPDLVVRDEKGEPLTVRYDQVNAMLLNEFLKEYRTVKDQNSKIQQQEATIAELKSRVAQQQKDFQATAAHQQKQIEALTAGLQKVSAQLEASKTGPQIVNNN